MPETTTNTITYEQIVEALKELKKFNEWRAQLKDQRAGVALRANAALRQFTYNRYKLETIEQGLPTPANADAMTDAQYKDAVDVTERALNATTFTEFSRNLNTILNENQISGDTLDGLLASKAVQENVSEENSKVFETYANLKGLEGIASNYENGKIKVNYNDEKDAVSKTIISAAAKEAGEALAKRAASRGYGEEFQNYMRGMALQIVKSQWYTGEQVKAYATVGFAKIKSEANERYSVAKDAINKDGRKVIQETVKEVVDNGAVKEYEDLMSTIATVEQSRAAA